MIGVRQREDEVADPQPGRQEQQRDEKHGKQVDEDREDVAWKRRSPLAGPIEDRVSEPRELFLERWQRRKVGPKLGVRLTDSLVALGVLRCAVGELDNLAEQRRHDDPADAEDESEACDVDQHRRQPERQARAPVKPLAGPGQSRGEEDAHEQDEQDMANHEQQDDRDDSQDGEQQPEIDRQRSVEERLPGIPRRHVDGIPVKRRC